LPIQFDFPVRKFAYHTKSGRPLSERRVLAFDGATVRIAHRHPDRHASQAFELDGAEIVRRLHLHMPEPRLRPERGPKPLATGARACHNTHRRLAAVYQGVPAPSEISVLNGEKQFTQ